jgi:hypothetical protein
MMMAKTTFIRSGDEEVCPECRVNQVEPPFDYCSLCVMLSSYYREKLAGPDLLADAKRLSDAYDKWRDSLTWAQIEGLRDTYWTPSKRAKARAKR